MHLVQFAFIICAYLAVVGCGSSNQKKAAANGGTPVAGNGGGSGTTATQAANAARQAAGPAAAPIAAVANGLDEVGLLFNIGNDNFVSESCTGTLVQTANHHASNVVLTAKHCDHIDAFYIGNGQALAYPNDHDWAKATQQMTAYRVIDDVVIDGASVAEGSCPHAALDIRLLRLDRNVAGNVPATIASTPPPLGAACSFVGFGVHMDAQTGQAVQMVKRRFSVALSSLSAAAAQQTDSSHGVPGSGDSGGPVFCQNRLVATDSCGFTLNGINDLNQSYARIDVASTWIDATIAAWTSTTAVAQAQ